jgi:hypothetical protein
MAIFIFTKNSDDVENSIFCIAANQTVLDENKNWDENKYDVLTVSDNDFNEVKLGNKIIKSKNGNTVTYETPVYKYYLAKHIQAALDTKIAAFEKYVKNHPSKPMTNSVNTWITYLKSLDPSTMITEPSADATFNNDTLSWSNGTPLTTSIEAYANSQGQTVISVLELI